MSLRGRAATTECCACHYIFPKPEMRQVRRTVGGGWKGGRKTTRYNRSGNATGYSRTERYYRQGRTVVDWYCSECYVTYARKRRIGCIGLLVAVFVAFIVLNSIGSRNKQRAVSANPGYEAVDVEDSIEPQVLPVGEQDPVGTAELQHGLVETEDLGADYAANSELELTQESVLEPLADQGASDPPAGITPENSSTLRAAISKAVATTQTQRWSARGHGGYAVASSREPASGCVTVYFTVDTVQPNWSSPHQTICPAN